MGKLNIAHHKSYHPYRRDNIERVRQDEEAARQAEAVAEGRMMLADSEARIDLLRARAGLAGAKARKKKHGEDGLGGTVAGPSTETALAVTTLTSTGGHINLFEDLERSVVSVDVRSTKKPQPVEDDKGVALAPTATDLKPWYVDAGRDTAASTSTARMKPWETEEDRRRRDLQRKSAHDPLTAINSQLSARPGLGPSASHSSSSSSAQRRGAPPPSARPDPQVPPEVSARLVRESAERERARALIARKKREMAGSETPSTVYGGGKGGGYGDVFNRKEVDEVRRDRQRGWERERTGDGGRRYGGRW